MADKDDYMGDSPRRDFYGALNRMLYSYDCLEQEDVPLAEYPHSEFVNHFVKKVKALYQSKDSKDLIPFGIARVPFEIAVGLRDTISELKREKNEKYIDTLLQLYKDNKEDSIYEHLESLKKLENGKRIFDFENKESHPHWNGWLPSNWRVFPEEWNEQKEVYENIGKEFEFAYSVARFCQLCEEQKKSDPAKGVCLEYFLNIKKNKDCQVQNCDDEALLSLKKYLTKPFSEEFSIEIFQKNIKYFSPYYLTDLEMNTFFEWSICLCSEKPNLTFFKEIWSLGKLYHINVLPFVFFDNTGSKINTPLLLKIRVLKEFLLKRKIKPPSAEQVKGIHESWENSIVWILRKPFREMFSHICNLHQYDPQYEVCKETENKKIIDQNKAAIEKAKSEVHPFLDWIDLNIDRPTDKKHRIFAMVIKALCLFSGNPKLFSIAIKSNKEKFLSLLNELFRRFNSNTIDCTSLPLLSKMESVPLLSNVEESFSPYIFVLIGLLERFLFPIAFPLKATPELLLQFESLANYVESPHARQVLEFRFDAIMGQTFSHSKIIVFATVYDFAGKFWFQSELCDICEEIVPLIDKESEKSRREAKEKLQSVDASKLDEGERKVFDETHDKIEEGERLSVMQKKALELGKSVQAQVEKKDLENH